MVNRVQIGRRVRSYRLSARLLTEWHALNLPRHPDFSDLRECLAAANEASLVIDVGAHVGNYSLLFAKQVGRRGNVLALEPNPSAFAALRASTWGSGVTCLNLAASDKNGRQTFSVPFADDGTELSQLASLEPRSNYPSKSFDVTCVRLDDIVPPEPSVSVIKVDVEGHEIEVIRGAHEIIERDHPRLVIEIESRHLVGRRIEAVVEEICGLGYDCHGLTPQGRLPWSRFDVKAHQLDHVTADKREILAGSRSSYVNNFVFTPVPV